MSAALASTRTLLLSNSYEPIKAISWQRAITLLTRGKVEILESYDGFVRSSTIVIKIPAVVRLLRSFRRYKREVKFNRANIMARDDGRCQYCGKKLKSSDLTYDHVVPRSQGGKTEWTNICCACPECNRKKGGRTPQQAGMKLLSKPEKPKWAPALTITINSGSAPEEWRSYMYWITPLNEN